MSELTERLRAWGTAGWWDKPLKRLCVEAADRIEELEAEVMRWKTGQARWQNSALAARIERLEDENRALQIMVDYYNPGPADIGMVQPEDFRGLSPYLRHGGVWGVFEVWTAEPLSGDVALFMEGPDE